MFRKFIIVSCLLSSVFIAFGQKEKKQGKGVKKEIPLFTTTSDGKKIFYNELGAPLPPVNFYKRNGLFITNENLSNDANLIIMLFNPTCEHCEIMGRAFKENIALFKNSNLVFVAAQGMYDYLPYFIDNTGIAKTEKIQVGIDSSGFVNQAFLYKSLPQINIYNKERKLEKIFVGEVPFDSIVPYIE